MKNIGRKNNKTILMNGKLNSYDEANFCNAIREVFKSNKEMIQENNMRYSDDASWHSNLQETAARSSRLACSPDCSDSDIMKISRVLSSLEGMDSENESIRIDPENDVFHALTRNDVVVAASGSGDDDHQRFVSAGDNLRNIESNNDLHDHGKRARKGVDKPSNSDLEDLTPHLSEVTKKERQPVGKEPEHPLVAVKTPQPNSDDDAVGLISKNNTPTSAGAGAALHNIENDNDLLDHGKRARERADKPSNSDLEDLTPHLNEVAEKKRQPVGQESEHVLVAAETPRPNNDQDIVGFVFSNGTTNSINAQILTFGQVFVRGDLMPDQNLTMNIDGKSTPVQMDVKARHDDGSVRHAVLSVEAPDMAARERKDAVLTIGEPNSTESKIDVMDIINSDYDVQIKIKQDGGAEETINIVDLLADAIGNNDVEPWLLGPLTSEFHIETAISDQLQLKVDIRLMNDHFLPNRYIHCE